MFHLYESGNRRESAEEIFNIPYNIPSIPQQEDGTKCGYYMLFYMFKFLTACPYQFDISKDYPGFVSSYLLAFCNLYVPNLCYDL